MARRLTKGLGLSAVDVVAAVVEIQLVSVRIDQGLNWAHALALSLGVGCGGKRRRRVNTLKEARGMHLAATGLYPVAPH